MHVLVHGHVLYARKTTDLINLLHKMFRPLSTSTQIRNKSNDSKPNSQPQYSKNLLTIQINSELNKEQQKDEWQKDRTIEQEIEKER